MKITVDQMYDIQRALGVIEGAAAGMDNGYAIAIVDAAQVISEIMASLPWSEAYEEELRKRGAECYTDGRVTKKTDTR